MAMETRPERVRDGPRTKFVDMDDLPDDIDIAN